MKCFRNLCLLTLLLLSSLAIQAQGNLQFNQVINIDMTGSSASTGEVVFQTQVVTVPIGKVWKIETASCRIASPTVESIMHGVSFNNRVLITIDNSPLSFYQATQNVGVVFYSQTMTPLWLPPGSHTLVLRAFVASGTPNTAYGKISVIEFNVVP